MSLSSLGIKDAASAVESGQASAEELVRDCLARIERFDGDIRAWAHLDPGHALTQARNRDTSRRKGKPCARLHGVPIAVKDIIDTALVPTEYGSVLFSGNLPKTDAFVVERLRQSGAVIMGKTVTTELATFSPGKTRNPHNAEHTPGGSSSGSAAAVASFMVPGALGTQTNGSVIRPASFCGTVGFKPSYGLVSRRGILTQSPFLDQPGVFTRSVTDAALLAELLIGPDPLDEPTRYHPLAPPLEKICAGEPPLTPKLALVKTHLWHKAGMAVQAGLEQIAERLAGQLEVVDLPPGFEQAWTCLKTVNEAEMACHYERIYSTGKAQLSDSLTGQIERGREVRAVDYQHAKAQRGQLNELLDEMFLSYDALLTPSAPGEAPRGLDSTGDPLFCTPWTFCGVPAVTLPLLQGENGLPVGVQLVGQRMDDGRLLRTARWLENYLNTTQAGQQSRQTDGLDT